MTEKKAARGPHGWSVVQEGSAGRVVRLSELDGVLVVEHSGAAPKLRHLDGRTCHDTPHISIAWMCSWSSTAGTEVWSIRVECLGGRWVRAQRRVLTAWSEKGPWSEEAFVAVLARARAQLPAAVQLLGEVDARYDAAERVTAPLRGLPHTMTRQDYESVCCDLDVEPMTDEAVDSYGVRYGEYTYPHYAPSHILAMGLAARRLNGIEAQRRETVSAPERPRPTRSFAWGERGVRYDEACWSCGAVADLDNAMDVCRRCYRE